MSQTAELGAARIRLIVDADDFNPIIEQGKNAVRGFGQEAQNAYDRTEKATRRAANTLLDYVNSLGSSDTAMDRYVRNARRLGVEQPVLDAAIGKWVQHTNKINESNQAIADQAAQVRLTQNVWKQFQAEQRVFDQQAKASIESLTAARIKAYQIEDARRSQEVFNRQLGVSTVDPRSQASRRDAATEAFLPIIQAENDALEKQKLLVETIATARAQQFASNAQQDFNKLLGIKEQEDSLALTRRRADAEAAFNSVQDSHVDAYQRNRAQQASIGQSFITQLKNTEQAAGKTYYELLRLKAAELGVSDAAEPFINRIQQANVSMGRGTISAKQYALAVRQLPAQFTDVFVSLAAGQNPLLVLLQQGGQVKDMFGGIKSAVAAVGKELLLLALNPFVLLAAAIGTVAVAAFAADSRLKDLAVSAAKGNGVAGSARDLSAYALQLATIKNIDLGAAESAVGKLAEGGRLAGQNFRLAAEASARWASVTGEAVDDVSSKFLSIASDPMAAILDGTVKITDAQYDQIRSLLDVGDKQGAVKTLVKIFYDQINNNTDQVVQNISNISQAFSEIKKNAKLAFDEIATGFDFLIGAYEKAGELQAQQSPFIRSLPGISSALAAFQGLYNAEPAQATAAGKEATSTVSTAALAAARAKNNKLTTETIKANEELARSWDASGSRADQLKAKVEKLNATLRNASASALAQRGIIRGEDGTFSGPGYQRLLKQIDDKTKKPRKPRAESQGPDPTKAIQERERTALLELRRIQQEFDYVYQDKLDTVESYYKKSQDLARQDADIQIRSNNEQIKALTGRKNSEDKIAALRQENKTVEENFAIKKARLDREEVLATRERTAALRDYAIQLADVNSQLSKGFNQQARGVGRGGRNSEISNALENAKFATDKAIRDIQNQLTDNKISPEEASAKQKNQYDALAENQRIIQQGYADIATAESDWLNGSVRAWEDWQQQVGDIATQVAQITTNALSGMATTIADKITEGKNGFKDYLNSINRQILDFVLKQQLTTFFKYIGKSTEGTSFGSLLTTFGSALFGSASAQGNVFAGGTLSAYRNQIVSQPTYFSKGGVPNVNIMGERSGKPYEAIMPLTRTSSGDLGVKVTNGQQQRPTNISQTFIVPGVPDRTTRDQLAIKTLGAAQRAARRN